MLEIKDLLISGFLNRNLIDDSSKSETSENDPEDIPVGQEKSGADAGSAKCRFFLLLYFLVVAHSCCVSFLLLLLECIFPQIFFQVRSGSGCCMNCLHRYQFLIIARDCFIVRILDECEMKELGSER